jgi:dihydroxy-acid dehydratase
MELNKYSKTITQDETQPAAQAMLYGIGSNWRRFKKKVGIVSMGYEGNPCNMHLNDLAKILKKELERRFSRSYFNTIGVSDGM